MNEDELKERGGKGGREGGREGGDLWKQATGGREALDFF
jgi:hypothetical protein